MLFVGSFRELILRRSILASSISIALGVARYSYPVVLIPAGCAGHLGRIDGHGGMDLVAGDSYCVRLKEDGTRLGRLQFVLESALHGLPPKFR